MSGPSLGGADEPKDEKADAEHARHLDLLRSTSMPVLPLVDEMPSSSASLDTQLLELFFHRVPMGVAVFDTDMRPQRCNKTWTAFYQHYLGVPADYTS